MTGQSVEALEATLRQALGPWTTVLAAWLFGSIAQGTDGPQSDVDVAVLGARDLSFDDRAQLVVDLAHASGRACDVVIVEQASPVLGREIVETGRRFLDRSPERADAWEDFAIRRHLGTAHLRKIVYEHVREDLAGARR